VPSIGRIAFLCPVYTTAPLRRVVADAFHRSSGRAVWPLWMWLKRLGTETIYITPGSLWENGYCESFNGKLRDELLNGEIFYTLKEAQVFIESWRRYYKHGTTAQCTRIPASGTGNQNQRQQLSNDRKGRLD